ncbi:citrate synthase 2 [Nocardiopsis sp. NPDC058631]|uniref:citrate synthase 2 n=1 Tax=Nocardiopsis sp. NPDC058631 TaxID=3346566 RepID=UPI00365AA3DE
MIKGKPGLSDIVAFDTEIAEPDREGGALRYRGTDVAALIGAVSYADVWGLLVDGDFTRPLLPAEPLTLGVHTGDVRADVQSAIVGIAPLLGLRQLIDIDVDRVRSDLATTTAVMLSFVAQAARGQHVPRVPQAEIERSQNIVERFMVEWRGDPDPRHVRAVDTYWISAAEHGMNASTFTSRVVSSTGADVPAAISAAVGAMSGPLHGGAPSRALHMVKEVERSGDARGYVKGLLDRGERIMGFGHPVYRAEDPRARILRQAAQELGAPRYEVAKALEDEILSQLREHKPDRVLATNVEYWAAVILDFAEIPDTMFTPMFTCARMAGWSAHVVEQKRLNKLIRPSAEYVGEVGIAPESVAGWDEMIARNRDLRSRA